MRGKVAQVYYCVNTVSRPGGVNPPGEFERPAGRLSPSLDIGGRSLCNAASSVAQEGGPIRGWRRPTEAVDFTARSIQRTGCGAEDGAGRPLALGVDGATDQRSAGAPTIRPVVPLRRLQR